MLEFGLKVDPSAPALPRSGAGEHFDCGSLTQRIAEGDREAFAIYYKHYFDTMLSEVQRLSGLDESTCLDIVHDSMLKVIRSLKRIDHPHQLQAWTRVVAKSATFDWLRKRVRERKLELPSDLPGENDVHDLEARMHWVQQQLSDLPKDVQQLFSMRYRWGWSLKRIAEKVGLKTGAVDGKIRRAIEKLKAKAERENHDEK